MDGVAARTGTPSPSELEISSDHFVFIRGKGPIPASLVKIGDALMGGQMLQWLNLYTAEECMPPSQHLEEFFVVNNFLAPTVISAQKDTAVLRVGKFLHLLPISG